MCRQVQLDETLPYCTSVCVCMQVRLDETLPYCTCICVCMQVRLDETQVGEAEDLGKRLEQEMELLMVYQSKVKENADAQHKRERKVLEERVSLRRALLEQKVSKTSVQIDREG